jgi:hypothetical protein
MHGSKVIAILNFGCFGNSQLLCAKMQLFQILLPASQWCIPASLFVYISHIAQPTLIKSLGLQMTLTIDIYMVGKILFD